MTTPPTTAPNRRRTSPLGRVAPFVAVFGLVAVVVGIVGFTCHRDSQIQASRDLFIDKLASGDVEGAYAELSAERRAAMSLEDFRTYVDHPVLQKLDAGNYAYPDDYHPGACMDGEIDMPDGQWQIQFFFLEEDRWRLHSIALQRPVSIMGLGTLLPECGFWQGTMRGYSGPPPEHATTPTRQ